MCDPQRPRDHIRLQPAIGIGEEDPLACGGAGADMARVTLAQPAVRQRLDPQGLQPRIL